MNTHELPMILFTVIAQMCVGAFIGLGVIQLAARARFKQKTIDQVTTPVLWAIGPILVAGLAVSMLHMNDIMHTLNVFRHWDSSWLSREIIFGLSFAAFGFLFALLQWFGWGPGWLREVVASVAAVLGVGLIWSMSMIYASLPTVPAWNTWVVPFQFFGTALILGSLAICAALLIVDAWRQRLAERGSSPAPAGSGLIGQIRGRIREINQPATEPQWRLTMRAVQGLSLTAAAAGIAVLISYTLHLTNLAQLGEVQAAEVFSGAFFVVRLALLGLSAVLMAFLAFRIAATATRRSARTLAVVVTLAFVLALVAELMGRSLHYESMFRLGI